MGVILNQMKNTPANIVVVGSINMDLVVRTPHLPVPGETVLGEDLQTLPGGKGANQAVAAARLGAHTTMLGCIGQDIFGTQLRENLSGAGVDCSHLCVKQDSASGVALIGIDGETAENSIIVAGGANRLLSKHELRAAEKVIENADVVVFQLEIPLEAVEEGLKLARKHGKNTILNAAPMCELSDALLANVDILIVNRTETAQLSGMPVVEMEDIEQASAVLFARGIKTIVVTLGSKGSYFIDSTHRTYLPAYPVKSVDTVGAGDAFVGAFAVGTADGMAPDELLKFCNACGGLATTTVGAQNSVPSRNEIEAFLESFH